MNRDLAIAAAAATALHAGVLLTLDRAGTAARVFNASDAGMQVVFMASPAEAATLPEPDDEPAAETPRPAAPEPEQPPHPVEPTPQLQLAEVDEPLQAVEPTPGPEAEPDVSTETPMPVVAAPEPEVTPVDPEPPTPEPRTAPPETDQAEATPLWTAGPWLPVTAFAQRPEVTRPATVRSVPEPAPQPAARPERAATAAAQPPPSTPNAGQAGDEAAQRQAVAVRNDPPPYPRIARRRGYEGVVELFVQVLASGACGEVQVRQSSGYRALDRAATKAVREWRFRPASRDGRSIESWIEVPVEFKLED
ncbi:MAG: energy transducer TonB [Planctomycetota bacterium]